jgi:hypothetical protein
MLVVFGQLEDMTALRKYFLLKFHRPNQAFSNLISNFRNLNTVEVYDPKTDKWNFGSSMCAHEGGVGLGVVPL